jgi:hypothetical protein
MKQCCKNKERMSFEQFLTALEHADGKSAGAMRVSLGLATNFADVYRFVEFTRSFLDKPAAEI